MLTVALLTHKKRIFFPLKVLGKFSKIKRGFVLDTIGNGLDEVINGR